jgi:hypothetical protein
MFLPDHLSQDGAERLAKRIAGWWRSRGYHGIACVVQPLDFGKSVRFIVRSNIGPTGFPPKVVQA